ncbi:MAG: hypothetical protein A3F13_07595 [Gammaproteobacteria bacterium RIFCSPHIGHO2_12_FULL_40_19]|nr:MAG: hypothetical protein A3F13_07595 [Gammaproteobacteria bacterium RIFCSPHIGHO2_12_FULL_40_19]
MNVRVLICTLAGIVAVALLLLFVPIQEFSAKGIILPAKQVRAAISPESVIIYSQTPQANFTRLGEVRAEIEFSVLDATVKDKLFEKVKTMAASVGANGVIINLMLPNNGVRQMLTFIGTAIYAPTSTTRSDRP